MAWFANKTADLVLIQVYKPTAEHNNTEMEETYELIEEGLKATKAEDNVTIMGDWNAIVGEGKDDNIVGQYGLGTRNDRGPRLIEFCKEVKHVITNTWNKVPKIRQYTWSSLGDLYRNQIDYILVKSRYQNQVLKSIAYAGADIDSDHNLLMMTCKLKWKKLSKPKKETKWNLENLKTKKREFQKHIEKELEEEIKKLGRHN